MQMVNVIFVKLLCDDGYVNMKWIFEHITVTLLTLSSDKIWIALMECINNICWSDQNLAATDQ
jgi:hypothetical protein